MLDSHPQVTVSWRGQRLALRQTGGLTFRFGSGPVVHALRPRQSAMIEWDWASWCGPRSLPNDRPTIRFRFGSALSLSAKLQEPKCAVRGSPSTIAIGQPQALVARKL
jgi:hypothetical protein